MEVKIIHSESQDIIKEGTDIFIPIAGDMLVIDNGDYSVEYRTIDYDKNIVLIYVYG